MAGTPVVQGWLSWSRLLTQGLGAGPSVAPLAAAQESASNDSAGSGVSGDSMTTIGGRG
ncbi:MAG TPA: hypothetical protein VFB38_19500 [Chthonomonadaceae bacterium]|nr:hypothetical protein [Chthonomonadaceae bacterium]